MSEPRQKEIHLDELVDFIVDACARYHEDKTLAAMEADRMISDALVYGEAEGCGIRVRASPKPHYFIVYY